LREPAAFRFVAYDSLVTCRRVNVTGVINI
jgi:hypothetical protein